MIVVSNWQIGNWQKENKAKSVIKETKTAVKRDHLPAGRNLNGKITPRVKF